MSFKKAVRQTPHLENHWMPGLQALRAQDRPHINPSNPHDLRGSVDVDNALRPQQPNANRWDFAIGYRHTNRGNRDCIYWVEIHTASDKEVKVVLAKLAWLKQWLDNGGQALREFERDFVWVSSGATHFTSSSPQSKQLSQSGLKHRGTVLKIPDERPKNGV